MEYEFVEFPGVGRGFSARASVRKNGQIGFNQGAVMHYKLQGYERAILLYDAQNKVIGVRLDATEGNAAACKIVHRPGNSYIAAKSFFDYFRIPLGERTTRYELGIDEGSGVLIIDLKRPLETRGSRNALDS